MAQGRGEQLRAELPFKSSDPATGENLEPLLDWLGVTGRLRAAGMAKGKKLIQADGRLTMADLQAMLTWYLEGFEAAHREFQTMGAI